MIRRAVLFMSVFLVIGHAQAAIKDVRITIDDETVLIPASCIESVTRTDPEISSTDGIIFKFESECSNPLSSLTMMNIGKVMVLNYNGNDVWSGVVTGKIYSSFRIDSKGGEPMMIRQILIDSVNR